MRSLLLQLLMLILLALLPTSGRGETVGSEADDSGGEEPMTDINLRSCCMALTPEDEEDEKTGEDAVFMSLW